MSCDRAYAYRYIAKIREPEYEWDDKSAPPRSRSRAVGKAVHAVLEAWQRGETPNWRDLPGQIALSGAHHVPHPDRVHVARVEAPIGNVALPPNESPDAPRVAYELHGVLWAGFRDLLVSAPGEFIRLKIDAPDGWVLYDYKTTASIERYALTAAELAVDPQACLYVAATCDELGLEELPVRWLYLESKKRRESRPVNAVIRAVDAKARLEEYAVRARKLDEIADVSQADVNTRACGEYGGCYYHVSNGGPCDARRSIGGLIQARVPKKDTIKMALDPAAQAAFSKFQANKNGVAKAAPPPPVEAPDAPADEAPAAQESTPVQTTVAPVKPRAKKAAAPSAGTPAATIAQLSATLVEAQTALDAAQARVTDLLSQIREACG